MLNYGRNQCRSDKTNHSVLWISGRPVAKCDPLRGRAIQHDHQSPDRWEHDQLENMQTNIFIKKISQNNSGNLEIIWATQFSTMAGPVGDP